MSSRHHERETGLIGARIQAAWEGLRGDGHVADGSKGDGVPNLGQGTVSREMLASVFTEFAEDIEVLETRLAEEVPGGSPQGIYRSLERVRDGLQSGERTMRAHSSINVCARVSDTPIGADLMRALVALDAKVNAVDDVIDTRRLDRRQKTHLMTVVGFSDLLLIENLPVQHVSEVAKIQRRYSVELAQIPIVEHRLLERLRSATSREERLDATITIYSYRARDIRAFAEIPAVVSKLDPMVVDRVVDDLLTFRARYLLFEDFRHVERDLGDGYENPIMALFHAGSDRQEIDWIVRELLTWFQYSTWAVGRYADLLANLERRPDEIEEAVTVGLRELEH